MKLYLSEVVCAEACRPNAPLARGAGRNGKNQGRQNILRAFGQYAAATPLAEFDPEPRMSEERSTA